MYVDHRLYDVDALLKDYHSNQPIKVQVSLEGRLVDTHMHTNVHL